jgi:hypothetical protein
LTVQEKASALVPILDLARCRVKDVPRETSRSLNCEARLFHVEHYLIARAVAWLLES